MSSIPFHKKTACLYCGTIHSYASYVTKISGPDNEKSPTRP
jgi:hypothetical protein